MPNFQRHCGCDDYARVPDPSCIINAVVICRDEDRIVLPDRRRILARPIGVLLARRARESEG
jgi:hypothetical protein